MGLEVEPDFGKKPAGETALPADPDYDPGVDPHDDTEDGDDSVLAERYGFPS